MSYRGNLTMRTIILPLLLAERKRSQRELAREFRVDRKTIKRQIDELSCVLPIIEERDGREVFYRLMDGYKYTPPNFTPLEIATLLLAQEAIRAAGLIAGASPLAVHANTLLLKIRTALPAEMHERIDALAQVYGSAAMPAKDFSAHARNIELLTEAAIQRRRVRIVYDSLTSGQKSERTVEPLVVYFDPDGATIKLIARDEQRQAIIPFSIDRIRELEITDETFIRPDDFNLEEFLRDNCFNGIHGAPVKVRLRAHGVTARIFAERRFHPSQKIIERTERTADTDETTTIEMRVAEGRGLVRFILSWTPDVEVLEPAELQMQIITAQQKALKRQLDAHYNPADTPKKTRAAKKYLAKLF
jgi:predicted DNA-binding transcriptional regulator YafY